MKLTNLTIILFIAITTSSCNFSYTHKNVDGNGNVVREEFEISEKIDVIKASTGLDVEIIFGSKQMVIIEADKNLHEYISTELNKGVLDITSTRNIRKAKAKKVTVIYVDIDAVQASSGAKLIGPTELVSNNLDLKASSGAQMDLIVLAKELTAQASSGGTITLRGQARNFGSKASSGSSIDAKELKAIYCTSRASSGGSISLNIERSLDAKASSGGEIKYQGEPEVVTQNTSSSGRVRKM